MPDEAPDMQNTTEYRIRCRVSGGVTGTRESELQEGDKPARFTTREQAQARVDWLMEHVARNPHRKATFEYWLEPIYDQDNNGV
jgi:hypothetical protein